MSPDGNQLMIVIRFFNENVYFCPFTFVIYERTNVIIPYVATAVITVTMSAYKVEVHGRIRSKSSKIS